MSADSGILNPSSPTSESGSLSSYINAGGVGYLGLLNTTCAIYRNTATTDGPYGGQTLTLQSSGVKCRLEMMSAREMVGQAQAVVSTHRLFLPASVDIRPEDVVQVSSVDYLVQFVDDSPGGKAHHIECMCKRVA